MMVYELMKEDLTTLIRMGDTGKVTRREYFMSMESAKAAAESDNGSPIDWKESHPEENSYVSSGDLGSHLYMIYPIEVKERADG